MDTRLLGIYPHNVPLEVLTEEGVIGAAIFVLLIAYCFRRTKLSLQHRLPIEIRNIIVVFAALTLFEFLVSFKQGNLLSSHMFFMSTILLAAINRFSIRGHEPENGASTLALGDRRPVHREHPATAPSWKPDPANMRPKN